MELERIGVRAQPSPEGGRDGVLVRVDVLERQGAQARRRHHDAVLPRAQRRRVCERPTELGADHLVHRLDRAFGRRPGQQQRLDARVVFALLGHDDVDLGLEVAEERARRDVGCRRDLLHRGRIETVALEQVDGGVDDRLASVRLLALAQPAERAAGPPGHHWSSMPPSVRFCHLSSPASGHRVSNVTH